MSKKASASRGGPKQKKNVSRKLILYFGVFALLIVALVVVNQQANKASSDNVYGIPTSQLSPQTVGLLDDPNYQNIILPEELDKRLADKESFFLYYFSAQCPHCIATTPQLNPLIEDAGVDVKQFNLDVYNDGYNKYDITYTPTLIYYENGVEVERIEGGFGPGITAETFTEFLNKHKATASL